MYIQPQQLGDLGKFRLKKVFRRARKVVKKVGRVVKKVAPIVAIGAAAWFAAPAVAGLIAKVGPAAAKLIASRAAAKRQQETGAPPESAGAADMNSYLAAEYADYQRQQQAGGAGGFMPAAYGGAGGFTPAAYGGASAYDGNGIAPTMETEQPSAPMPQWVIPAAIGAVALLMLTQRR